MPVGPRRAAVLGSPISHSLSPTLHRAAYAALGLDWTYEAIEVDAAGLPAAMAGLDGDWAGLSLTMPLKEAVLPLLDRVSPTVATTGAANTVLFDDGQRSGHNTDVFGIVAALQEAGLERCESACIIGAGATARSAAVAAAQMGAARVVVVARRPQAAGAVLAAAAAVGVSATVADWRDAGDAMRSGLVVSTVPGDAAAALADRIPAAAGVLLDVTYRPWPTTLASAWQRAGGTVAPGAAMLLWQAARQVELMTGRTAPVAAMRQALAAG